VRDVTEDDCLVVMACDGVWDVLSDQEAIGPNSQNFSKAQEFSKVKIVVVMAYIHASSPRVCVFFCV